MPRYLRLYLLACTVLAFGYLVLHAGEPLRLNVGDPWADASVLNAIDGTDAHTASVPELIYGTVGRLVGPHQIVVFRVLALVFSGLAAWLLFQWARRLWNDTVATIATALVTTTMSWLVFADSIQRPPIVHAACFLALYGVVRALETGLRRHYIAALVGTFVCLYAGSTDWVFLPSGVLFTAYVKRGDSKRLDWRVIAVCGAAALLAALLRSPFAAGAASWQTTLDQAVATKYANLVRRYTALLTPMLWVTLGWAVWRAVRAPSVKAAIEDGTTWLLVAAVVFAHLVPPPLPESAALRTQLLLPLYALGSALLLDRLFARGRRLSRSLATTCCVLAPAWGFWLVLSHPREVLARDDVARANEYLAHNDGNGFVMSNLLAEGPILADFGRRSWIAPDDRDSSTAGHSMLDLFEASGTDYVHVLIFTTAGSRFVDRSIAQTTHRRITSVDGWPYLVRTKVNELIELYDRDVQRNLDAVGAKRVLHLGNFDIYRIDRKTVLEVAARSLPVVHEIDFDSIAAGRYQLLGWGKPVKPTAEAHATRSSITGFGRCRNPIATTTQPAQNACTVVSTPGGLDVLDVGGVSGAELLVRVDRVCDQQLTITLAAPARIAVAFNGATVLSCDDPHAATSSISIRVAQQYIHLGPNIISLHDAGEEPKKVRPEVRSVTIEPVCE